MNQTNKEERSSAEPGEKRARAKENIVSFNTCPTQCGALSVSRTERCTRSHAPRHLSKVGAVCGKAARTDLCGGRSAMVVPTATPYQLAGSSRIRNALALGIISRSSVRVLWVHWVSLGQTADVHRPLDADRYRTLSRSCMCEWCPACAEAASTPEFCSVNSWLV
jgi:hypothetical protein